MLIVCHSEHVSRRGTNTTIDGFGVGYEFSGRRNSDRFSLTVRLVYLVQPKANIRNGMLGEQNARAIVWDVPKIQFVNNQSLAFIAW